jgi:hypothetical protein
MSHGISRLSKDWTPGLTARLCALDSPLAPPFGIIHSSPGMDWRHTGLPPDEYRFWLSQTPAVGASVWHSITGLPDTVTDKRILEQVKWVNRLDAAQDAEIDNASLVSDIDLLYSCDCPPNGWMRALQERQYQFGVLTGKYVIPGISHSKAVILPSGYPVNEDLAYGLAGFVREGGSLILEAPVPEQAALMEAAGIVPPLKSGEYQYASYLRPEPAWAGLSDELPPLIAMRGKVWIFKPAAGSRMLASFVPPFAPLEAVGAPPERASIPTPNTRIPLIIERTYGKGRVLTLTFQLNHLIEEFGLYEHILLASSLFDLCVGDRSLDITPFPGLTANLFEKPDLLLLELVNGAGKRPLTGCTPLRGLSVSVKLPRGKQAVKTARLFDGEELAFTQGGGKVDFAVDRLDVWEAVAVYLS